MIAIIALVTGFVGGFVTAYFVFRNNPNKVAKVGDIVSAIKK